MSCLHILASSTVPFGKVTVRLTQSLETAFEPVTFICNSLSELVVGSGCDKGGGFFSFENELVNLFRSFIYGDGFVIR